MDENEKTTTTLETALERIGALRFAMKLNRADRRAKKRSSKLRGSGYTKKIIKSKRRKTWPRKGKGK